MTAGAPFVARRGHHGAWLARRTAAAAVVVAAGDGLLRVQQPGFSLALFVVVLAAAGSLVNPIRATPRDGMAAGGAILAGIAPTLVDPGPLAAGFLSLALAAQAWLLAGGARSLASQAAMAATLPWIGPFRLSRDLWRLHRLGRRARRGPPRWAALAGWVVPLGLSVVFVGLFADANPVLQDWLLALDPDRLAGLVDPERVAFWGLLVAFAWPVLHAVVPRTAGLPLRVSLPASDTALFGEAVVLRSLVLFNGVFAVQTGLDATYLWAGHALPQGLTHASYAHRGAYPLIVSALLAGLFSLAALRHDRPGGDGLTTRGLLLLFLAQNVALVASSMRRLDLYIDAYGTTQWRLSALVWMGLVGFGLATIAVRIAARKTSAWILRANAVAALVVLYACSLAPFDAIIARSNLKRCIEGRCTTVPLDWAYLARLGPGIVPALDEAVRRSNDARLTERAAGLREQLSRAFLAEPRDWRQWSLETWRLERYLAKQGATRSAGAAE